MARFLYASLALLLHNVQGLTPNDSTERVTTATTTTTIYDKKSWEIVSGSEYCQISDDGRCVTDGVGGYGHNEICVIRTLRPLVATATEYDIEHGYDFLTVAGEKYMGAGPQGVELDHGAELVWKSDHAVSRGGFTVCATPVSEFWEIVSGSEYCQISNDGRCITDGVGGYGHNENCEIRTLRPLVATATEYDIEHGYDFLMVAGVKYMGADGPQGLQLDQGAELEWKSDFSVGKGGFTVCATPVSELWEIVSGFEFCQISNDGLCITDGVGGYGHNENCEIKTLRPLVIETTEYDIEHGYDFLTVAGVEYMGADGPQGVELDHGAELVWKSDHAVSRGGFTVCATPVSELWEIVSGIEFCQISNDGLCITDGVGGYGHNEICEIRTLQPLVATATEYDIEHGYDFLTVAGVKYMGADGPQGLQLDQGAELVWLSDFSVGKAGFTVCATPVSTPAPSRRDLSVQEGEESEQLKNTGTIRNMIRLRGSR